MINARILMIDYDEIACASFCNFMQAAGYEMLCVQNGDEGLKLATDAQPDLVLLDIGMPGMDGWEVLRRLRERSSVPIIILTAKSTETDILHGFHLGADDYVTKPFSFAELEVRVAAVLSRARVIHASRDTLTSDELTINFERKHVWSEGKKVNLTPTEYRLLEALARHANRTIPLTRLLAEVWGSNYDGDEQYIKQFIWSLRKKLEENPDEPKHLKTRRGYGYRFE